MRQLVILVVSLGLLVTTIAFFAGIVNLLYITAKPLFRKIEKHFINVFEIGASAGITLLGFLNPTFAIIIIAMLVVGAVADLLLTEWEKGNIKFPSLKLKPIAVAGMLFVASLSQAVDLENVRQEDLVFNENVTEIVGYRTGSDYIEIEPIPITEYENFNPKGVIHTETRIKAWHLVAMIIGSVGVWYVGRKYLKLK
jgi:hypothetical protein